MDDPEQINPKVFNNIEAKGGNIEATPKQSIKTESAMIKKIKSNVDSNEIHKKLSASLSDASQKLQKKSYHFTSDKPIHNQSSAKQSEVTVASSTATKPSSAQMSTTSSINKPKSNSISTGLCLIVVMLLCVALWLGLRSGGAKYFLQSHADLDSDDSIASHAFQPTRVRYNPGDVPEDEPYDDATS